ncbi:hypothetical protein ACX80Z_11400 [Arthrobacter sp. TMT4-20]
MILQRLPTPSLATIAGTILASVQAFAPPSETSFWGASMDDWRTVSADIEDGFARLSLVNTFDSDFTGYALMDSEFGVVVEIKRPPIKMTLPDLHVSIPVQNGS